MSNPAFIVDGFTEQKIVQKICPGKPVRRTDLNGRDVTIEAIAKKIASLIRLLGNRHYPIVILVDKEDRSITCKEMSQQLDDAIREQGIKDQDLRIGIADRMIENWIIADWEIFNGNPVHKPKVIDGLNGCSVIKKQKGNYDKIIDGVELFLSARPKEISNNSPSYRLFIDKLRDINCEYLNI